MSNFEQILALGIEQLGLAVPNLAKNQLVEHAKLLHKWNQTYNLTAAKNLEEIVVNHILDSLAIASYVVGPYVLDVGSGAGFPGIPLALILPNCKFVLLDSVGKKIRFLNHIKRSLQLDNVLIHKERVEKFKFSYCFATIVTRAFARLGDIITSTKHLYCTDGQLLAMKGRYPGQELKVLAAGLAHLDIKVFKLSVPYLDRERHLVCIKGIIHGQNYCNC